MTTKEDAKTRGMLLKRLRQEHEESVRRTQALFKAQKETRREICRHMRETPRAVPELAQLTGLPANEVLWQVMAMKKYGLVVETGMCGEYYLYQRVEDKK